MSQKCALAVREVKHIPGCIIKSVVNRKRKVIFSLYSALVRLHLECCVQFWAPQCEKDTGVPEQVHQRPRSYLNAGAQVYKYRLRELGLFSLKKKKLGRSGLYFYSYLIRD